MRKKWNQTKWFSILNLLDGFNKDGKKKKGESVTEKQSET
mgnify:CR=1 FL=1